MDVVGDAPTLAASTLAQDSVVAKYAVFNSAGAAGLDPSTPHPVPVEPS